MTGVLTLLLAHQRAPDIERILSRWAAVAEPAEILLAYGGSEREFAKIGRENKIFVADPRLRTKDHQREFQSYSGVLSTAWEWLQSRPHLEHIHVVEFDHVPLLAGLQSLIMERARVHSADVLAHHLQRIDGTNHPHYLYASRDRRLHGFTSAISRRDDPAVILSMLGTGSFWTRQAFAAVAAQGEPFPIYFELYLPTIAHHLGFRVRDLEEQNKFVTNSGDFANALDRCRADGAWAVHPVKMRPVAAPAL